MTNPESSPFGTFAKMSQDYSAKLMEFGVINAKAALQFSQDLCTAKSPSEAANVVVDYTRRNFEAMTEQFEELASIGNQSQSRNGEPLGLGD
jgi:hypothetical protein